MKYDQTLNQFSILLLDKIVNQFQSIKFEMFMDIEYKYMINI